MVESFFSKKDEKLDFRQITLGHFKKIMELSCNEFRGGYYDWIYQGNNVHKKYVPDKRMEFIQAIEVLGISLIPYFDQEMKNAWNKYREDLKEIEDKHSDDEGLIKVEDNVRFAAKKLKLSYVLLEEISKLLMRIDYFVAQDFEDEDDIALADIDYPADNIPEDA